jgi:osmotically-inducible protein OsmY
MKTDLQLKEDVLSVLELEAKIDPSELGVSVENGIVTLKGNVETDEDRTSTERALRLITGLKGMVDDELRVHSARRTRPNDAEIQAAAGEAIQWLTTVPRETIKVTARDGWLTLEGKVEERHQAQCIEELMREVPGVRGVKNALTVLEHQQVA